MFTTQKSKPKERRETVIGDSSSGSDNNSDEEEEKIVTKANKPKILGQSRADDENSIRRTSNNIFEMDRDIQMKKMLAELLQQSEGDRMSYGEISDDTR